MKRDLDLARQLLADIEAQAADCAVNALRPGLAAEADEQVRYHVRLLIDAGLLKEVDRSAGGVPCVRLTHAGHEFLELAASESRWREAKWVVRERTGGMSLTVLKAVLTKWAAEVATRGPRLGRPAYRPFTYRVEPRYGDRPYAYEPRRVRERDWLSAEEAPRSVRPRPDYLERFDWRDALDGRHTVDAREAYDWRDSLNWRESADRERFVRETYPRESYRYDWETDEYGVSLPIQVV
ncbi:DUF2513 domain-containing protein [Botrimarina hoheduenensis]|uniref:DUF2513 domain-containing protein n=1 Tax=Botrimarina hoheduenensis TaxID=2528000 RepID=A0A5C5W9D5_9BACT|nr:DUF2513 domain-containing protein [Botrimarina hoheduenensis]TWT46805.1 hypothetical protein Pla111_19070 [Botrimarina hoheduenensis]